MPITRNRKMPTGAPPSKSIATNASAIIDVWHANLAFTETEIAHLSRCVDTEEERRASNFHLPRDRHRFLSARGVLRHILAPYVDTEPGRLGFAYGPQGKPFLHRHPDVHFNLSHTADVLLVAVARGRRLGVDVEHIIPEAVVDEVIGTVSSEPERMILRDLDPIARQVNFSRLWTRKEAYIKADGRGLSLDLKCIDVLSLPNRPRVYGGLSPAWRPCRLWTICDLAMGPGLAAAVAAEGSDWRVARFEWSSEAG